MNLKWTGVDRKDGRAVLGGWIRVGAESKGHRARHVPTRRPHAWLRMQNDGCKLMSNDQVPVAQLDRAAVS
jgi:hypothetical protein